MKKTVRFFLAMVVLFLSPQVSWAGMALFPAGTLSVITAKGVVALNVEIAKTPLQLQQGLMFRRHMALDHGMVFELEKAQRVKMWMKNTFIPLDMVFINDKGVVAEIAANATPLSEKVIASQGDNIKTVLEVNGGACRQYGIAVGDRVEGDILR